MREEIAQKGLRAGLKQELGGVAASSSSDSNPSIFSPLISPTGRNSKETGCWVSVLTKRVATIWTWSTSRFQEEVAGKGGDRPGLGKSRRVGIGELGDKLPAGAGDELRGLAPGGDEHRGLGIKLGGHAEQVAVERPAQALIGADQDDARVGGLRALPAADG